MGDGCCNLVGDYVEVLVLEGGVGVLNLIEVLVGFICVLKYVFFLSM